MAHVTHMADWHAFRTRNRKIRASIPLQFGCNKPASPATTKSCERMACRHGGGGTLGDLPTAGAVTARLPLIYVDLAGPYSRRSAVLAALG